MNTLSMELIFYIIMFKGINEIVGKELISHGDCDKTQIFVKTKNMLFMKTS